MKNILNEKHGFLVPIYFLGYTEKNKYGQRHAIWRCKCECGNYINRTSDVILRNKSSCGCKQKENLKKMSEINTTHKLSKTRLYKTYNSMVSRCYREKDIHYKSYGNRGIKVCDEWLNNRNLFFEWALNNGYNEELTIERKDNDLGYSPENCTFITKEMQYKNKRQNIMIEHNGKKLCASDWAKITGMNAQTIRYRYKKGYSAENIFQPLPKPYQKGTQ